MARKTQDIYRNREKIAGLGTTPGNDSGSRTWFLQSTGSRWPFALLLIAAVMTLGLLGLLLHYRLSAARLTSLTAAPVPVSTQTMKMRTAQRMSLDADPQGEWILDELEDTTGTQLEEGRTPEMTAHWVKQAGVQIRNAELAFRDKNWKEAIARYLQARAILPGIVDLDRRLGIAYLRERNFAEAEPFLKADAERNPDSAPVQNNLGVARMGQGHLEDAEKDFKEALRLDPNYTPAKLNVALLFFKSGNMADAVDALDAAQTAYPDDTDLPLMKAIALIRLERWPEAEVLLTESAARFKETAPIHFRLAEVRAHIGDINGSVSALKKAISLVDAPRAMREITRKEFDPLRDQPEFEALATELSQAIH